MSTITRERVAQFINNPLDNGLTRGEQMELARIALASLEAEPIYQLWDMGFYDTDKETYDALASSSACARIVYAAPPAAVVPDEIATTLIAAIEKEQDRLFGQDYLMDSKDCIDVIREEMDRLKARRAAMLQGEATSDRLVKEGYQCTK